MTETECGDLLKFAANCFPPLGVWLRDAGEATIAIWKDSLSDLDYESCQRALRQMVSGERDMPPYTGLPAALRRACRAETWQTHSEPTEWQHVDEPTYRCVECLDSGWIEVVNYGQNFGKFKRLPPDWRDIPAESWTLHVSTCNVACTCDTGFKLSERRWMHSSREGLQPSKHEPPPQYDARVHCRVNAMMSEKDKFVTLLRWARETHERPLAENYEPAFDQFNAGELV